MTHWRASSTFHLLALPSGRTWTGRRPEGESGHLRAPNQAHRPSPEIKRSEFLFSLNGSVSSFHGFVQRIRLTLAGFNLDCFCHLIKLLLVEPVIVPVFPLVRPARVSRLLTLSQLGELIRYRGREPTPVARPIPCARLQTPVLTQVPEAGNHLLLCRAGTRLASRVHHVNNQTSTWLDIRLTFFLEVAVKGVPQTRILSGC
jgi:hypothetical protein